MDTSQAVTHVPPAPPPSTAAISGSRITVVCAECKRLKLRCDRRTPCSSCVKRDTVSRCLYTAAAQEKIDLQSLYNRIVSLETSFQTLLATGLRRPASTEYERTVLATGPTGSSSVVVSLEDVASIWLEQLEVLKDVDLRVLPPDYNQERYKMAFPEMHLFMDPDFPDEGPCVTLKLINQLPNEATCKHLLDQLQTTMIMHPSFHFPTFRKRVEALFDPNLFSSESDGERMDSDKPSTLAGRPSLAFFAAAVGGLALGARTASTSKPGTSPGPTHESGSSSGAPSPPQTELSIAPYNADSLFLLSKQALAVSEFNQNYDLDYITAIILNGLFLLHDGKPRVAHTIYPTVGKLVNICKMMGLHIDPDEFPKKYSLFDAENRRRMWWDVYYYDVLMSDSMGQDPLIDDETCTTRLPTDVDEEAFHPGSTTLPAVSEPSTSTYFILKCRLARLIKTMRRRWVAEQPTMEMWMEAAQEFEADVNTWMAELPAPFKWSPRPPSEDESPYVVAQRCELAALANSLILKAYSPLLKRTPSRPLQAPSREAQLACSNAAHVIVQASQGLYNAFGHSRPASYVFYSFGRQIFVAAAVAASIVIQTPSAIIAEPAMADLECALSLMLQPPIAGTRGNGLEASATPSGSLQIVEMLHAKAKEALKLGGLPHAGSKRKHGEVEEGVPMGFTLPFVGSSLVTGPGLTNSAPPVRPPSPANGPSPKSRLRSATTASAKRAAAAAESTTNDEGGTPKTRISPGAGAGSAAASRAGSVSGTAANATASTSASQSTRSTRERRRKTQYPAIGIRNRNRDTARSQAESVSSESSSTHMTGVANGANPAAPESVTHTHSRPGTSLGGSVAGGASGTGGIGPSGGQAPGAAGSSSSPFRTPLPLPPDQMRPPLGPPPGRRGSVSSASYDMGSYAVPADPPSSYAQYGTGRPMFNGADYITHSSVPSASSSPSNAFYMGYGSGPPMERPPGYEVSSASTSHDMGISMSTSGMSSHRPVMENPQHDSQPHPLLPPHPMHSQSQMGSYAPSLHQSASFDGSNPMQRPRTRHDSMGYASSSVVPSQRPRYSDVDMKPPLPPYTMEASNGSASGPSNRDSPGHGMVGDLGGLGQQPQQQSQSQQSMQHSSPYGNGLQPPPPPGSSQWDDRQPQQTHPQHSQSSAAYGTPQWPSSYEY